MHTAGGGAVVLGHDRHDDLLDMTYCGLSVYRSPSDTRNECG